MDRVAFYIDGFNFYHSLDDVPAFHKYKWTNYDKLARCFITGGQELVAVNYFTAVCDWIPGKKRKHTDLIAANQEQGVSVFEGKFKRRRVKCPTCKTLEARCLNCGTVIDRPEEKRSDVNLAIMALRDAINDVYDVGFILSGDSDLRMCVEAVKDLKKPEKKIYIVIPIGNPDTGRNTRHSDDLIEAADGKRHIREYHLQSSQLPDIVQTGRARLVRRPDNWV